MYPKWFRYAQFRTACILAIFVILTTGNAQAQEPSPTYDPEQVPVPERLPIVGLGADVYANNCAPCHGVSGDGDGPAGAGAAIDPTVFSDPQAIWDRSPAELFFITKFGRIEKLMPPWRNSLNDEQIWQAVYYAWNLHAGESDVLAGAELYAQSCAACHGANGRGDGPDASAEMTDFSAQSSMIFISQAELAQRWQDAHADLGADWSAAQRQATLEYIRTFTYQPEWVPLMLSGPGMITGKLLQGTANGPPLPQTDVTLNIYQQANLLTTRSATVEVDGSFRFEELPVDVGYYYLAEAEYGGIRYTSPILAFSGPDFIEDRVGPNRIETSLPVYETTNDMSGVHIGRANWIIEHEPGFLLIGQVFTFGNRNDRTYIGEKTEGVDLPVTLAMPLPANAQDVALQDGEIGGDYRQQGQTLYDTRPVPPGEGSRQVFVRYRIGFDGNSVETAFPVAYEIALLNLLVADLPTLDVEVSLADDARVATGQDTIQGVLFRRWSAPLSADAPVRIALRGLIAASGRDPRPGGETQLNRSLPVATPPLDVRIPLAFGSVVGLVLLAAVILFLRRERAKGAATVEDLTARRQELIAQIARLDDLHALGELDERAWQQQRASRKDELLAIAQAEHRTELSR